MTNRLSTIIQAYACLFAISWGLNLIWETAHSFLYRDMPPLLYHLPFLGLASIGDATITIFLVLWVGAGLRDLLWFLKPSARGLLALVALSVVASAAIEYLNYAVLGRWQYTAAMPLLPIVHIGLTPFLEMALLPAAASVITANRCRKRSSQS